MKGNRGYRGYKGYRGDRGGWEWKMENEGGEGVMMVCWMIRIFKYIYTFMYLFINNLCIYAFPPSPTLSSFLFSLSFLNT